MQGRTTSPVLVAGFLAIALALVGCGSEKPPPEDAPRVNLVQVTSQSGTVTAGITFRSVKSESFENVEVEMVLGGDDGVEAGAPSGFTTDGVKGSKVVWKGERITGPVVLGPFVVRSPGKNPPPPKSATVRWKGGSAETREVKSRAAGVALGVGTVRQELTTAHIMVGRETEVTGYAMGLSLIQPRDLLITKEKVPDPPSPTEATSTITLASGSLGIKPEPTAPILLEMTAPRPLPPYAVVRVEVGKGEDPLAETGLTGRVGPMGDRIYVPFASSGRYRASLDLAAYKAASTPMYAPDTEGRGVISARAGEVAQMMKPQTYPALAATDSDESVTLLAIERARPGVTIPTSIPDGLSLNGLAVCSVISCIANNAPAGALNFCDLTNDITQCMPIDRPGEEVTVTVSGRDPVFSYCQSHACFVPGRGIVENRPAAETLASPMGMMVAGEEMIWVANPTGG